MLLRPGAGRRARRTDTVVLGRPAGAAAAVYSAAKAFRAAENGAVVCFWTGTGSVAWLPGVSFISVGPRVGDLAKAFYLYHIPPHCALSHPTSNVQRSSLPT